MAITEINDPFGKDCVTRRYPMRTSLAHSHHSLMTATDLAARALRWLKGRLARIVEARARQQIDHFLKDLDAQFLADIGLLKELSRAGPAVDSQHKSQLIAIAALASVPRQRREGQT
jgi:hypothetical protein